MDSILQGTTPTLEVVIDTDDFLVENVTAAELAIKYNGKTTIHGLQDLTVSVQNNSFSYKFQEAETLALAPEKEMRYQMRFKFGDGSIVGTEQIVLKVADLISEEPL